MSQNKVVSIESLRLARSARSEPVVTRFRPAHRPVRAALDETAPVDGAFRDDIAYEEHEFVHRINSLRNALAEFATSYHAGNVIDVKKARAVRKALRELEKSEWFKPQKAE